MTSSPTTAADEPAPSEWPPLDEAALANLARLDPTGATRLVQRVLATYQSSLAQLLGQLRQAFERDDLAGIRLAVHTLKSSSASIGALRLSADCGAVEQAVRDGRTEGLPAMIDRLTNEAARVEDAVGKLLNT